MTTKFHKSSMGRDCRNSKLCIYKGDRPCSSHTTTTRSVGRSRCRLLPKLVPDKNGILGP